MPKTNALAVAAKLRRRLRRIDNIGRRAMRKSLAAVDRQQLKLLSGSNAAAPGTYPVPNRTGDLSRGHGWRVTGPSRGIIQNTSDHAFSVHEGDGVNRRHGRRPFLEDAVAKTDVVGIYRRELTEALK